MANKAILLDRDDTLIEDPGYINHPSQVRLLDGVAEALIELRSLGYKLVVVSNQSGVARGIISEPVLGEIHDRLKSLLAEKGAHLDAIYYCPFHPDGTIAKYRRESELRKPSPGMILQAAKEMDLNLSQSWAIGNSDRDIEAGRRAGCKTILLDSLGRDKNLVPSLAKPDFRAVNLREAANIIKKIQRNVEKPLLGQQVIQQVQQAEPEEKIENIKQEVTAEPVLEEIESPQTTEQLLKETLEQLKRGRREEMFGEFSWLRFFAWFLQAIVALCLLISIWLVMNPARRDGSVLIAIGFATVLQLMSLTFHLIHGRK